MKGKVIVIVSAMILAAGVFILAGNNNMTSAFSQNNNGIVKVSQNNNVQKGTKYKADIKNEISPVNVAQKNIKTSSEYIDVDIKYPYITGLKNIEIQNSINSRLESDAVSFKEENEKSAKKDIEEFKKNNVEFRKYEAASQYNLHYNKNGLLSLTVDYYIYSGGAHGMTNRISYNYDLKTGDELKLRNLFTDNFDYMGLINKEILRQMKEGQDIYFHDEGVFKSISYNQPFYITEGNIVIYFGLYEIAPYAAGFPEFKIPISGFGDNIKIKF